MLDGEGVVLLAKAIPNAKAMGFLDWFLYSDNTIDRQSKKKAYQLFESGILKTVDPRYNQMFTTDTRLSLWRIIRFCRTNPHEEYIQRRFYLC